MTNTLRAVYGPELIVMYVQGACGNINHCAYLQNNPYPGKGVWKSEQMGRAFAGKALTIAEKALPSKTNKVGTAREILDVPMYPRDMVLEQRVAAAKAKENPSAAEKRLIELVETYDPKALRRAKCRLCASATLFFAVRRVSISWNGAWKSRNGRRLTTPSSPNCAMMP